MHPAQPVCGKESFMSYTISPPEETALQAHLHKLRTQLHEDPELSWQEHRTTRLVRRELEALCLEPVPLSLAMTLPKRFVTLTSSILQFDSKAVILSCMDLLGNLHNFQS